MDNVEFKTATSRTELDHLADAMPQAVWIADADEKVHYFNQRMKEFAEVKELGDARYDWRSLIHPDDLRATIRAWTDSAEKGDAFSHEHRILMADGKYRWHLSRAVAAPEDGANVRKWFGTATDVHDLKAAEKAFRKAEERLRLSVVAGKLGTWESDPNRRELYWDDRTRELFGVEQNDRVVFDETIWNVIPNEEHSLVRIAIEKALRPDGDGVYEVQHRVRLRDGSMRWLHNTGLVEFRGEGPSRKPVLIRGTVADVTERKEEETRIALLARLGDLIRTVEDPQELLYAVSKAVSDNLGARRCLFSEIDLENDLEIIHRDYTNGYPSIAGKRGLSVHGSAMVEELRKGRTVVNVDSKVDPRTEQLYPNSYLRSGERSFISVPLMRGGICVARLGVSYDKPRVWSQAEVRLVESIGERTWLAVEKLKSDAALRDTATRLSLASRVGDYGTLDINYETNTMIWSEKLYEIFGLGHLSDTPTSFEEFESMLDREGAAFLREFNRGPGEKVSDFSGEYRIRHAETKEERWINAAAKFFYDHDERAIRCVGVVKDITDRKLGEQKLQKANERYVLAQKAGRVGVWDWDGETGRTYWSETMWELYGEKPEAVNPDEEYWSAHLHDDDRQRVRFDLQEAIASDADSFHDEFRIVLNDGSIRWIQSDAVITRNKLGKALRVYGVNLDVTHRKIAEETIQASEKQIRLITNALPALISRADRSGRYLFVNEAFTQWFEQPQDELIGKEIGEVVGASAFREIKPHLDRVLAGEDVSFEAELELRKAGKKFVRVAFVPDTGRDGEVVGFFALMDDLTELKRSEELIRSYEKRMALLIETATEYAIFSMDHNGIVDTWNKGAKMIFGYSPEEIIGKSCEVLFVPEDVERDVPTKEMETARQNGRASDDRWHIRQDGSRFFASGAMMPLFSGEELKGYAKIARDLTIVKRQAEELQRAHDELEMRVEERTSQLAESNQALLDEMSEREVAERQRIDLLHRLISSQEMERQRIARDIHDQLGQRLTALRLKIASLKEAATGDPELASRIERLQEVSETLDSEVSFLAWELRPTSLDDLGFVEAIGEFVTEWSKHVEIAGEFHSTDLAGAAIGREAETHLYRVTQEALNNIAKHSGATSVTVLLERRDEHLILIIEDNGNGFTPPIEPQPSESVSGGLGLIGMRERALLVGGEFEIESAPGNGTTIFVRIPISS